MKWREDPGMREALNGLFDALTHESGGGGVETSKPIAAQGIRGFALFLDDGRVAVMDLEREADA